MNVRILFIVSILIISQIENIIAQSHPSKYRVYFTDKSDATFDPYAYFDLAAIQRRLQQNMPLYDYYDLPVNDAYVGVLKQHDIQVKLLSRWLNAAIVIAEESQIHKIESLPFVAYVEKAENIKVHIAAHDIDDEPLDAGRLKVTDRKILKDQTARMDAETFLKLGLKGQGIRICVSDVGFSGADNHPAFEHLRKNNKIVATKDFVAGGENVYRGGWHGTAVLSCIAGIIGNSPGGLAPEAEFLLARTEWGNKEIFAEEENWVAAAEWADQMGARIINSSLGYTNDRYFQHDMNGRKTFITRGANIAAKKGLLIINAAGNEGAGKWRIIGAPADADSVLSVGGVVPFVNKQINFSSFGPTWDLRMKPNVSAQGTAIAAVTKGVKSVDGTSFAAPLVTGFAACIWQKFPEKSNMEIFSMIEKSGHLYPYFDYAHGFGVPSAGRALQIDTLAKTKPFSIERDDSNADLVKVLIHEIDSTSQNLLYYHIADHRNVLREYYLMDIKDNLQPLVLKASRTRKPAILRVHYKGDTQEFKF
ncbi:MAG: S8 family serine peptidase [Flavobacteriales bacterium]